jgi:hypothetical protein
MDEIAGSLLPADLGDRLVREVAPESRHARFELDRETFEHQVGTRVFELRTGVIVTSPIGEVGGANDSDKSVLVDGDQLNCAGTIVGERFGVSRRRIA